MFFIDFLMDFGRPREAPGRQKRFQKRCRKKHEKKGLQVMQATRKFSPRGGGGPYKIPAGRQGLQVPEGSGPREWIIQAMLQETGQNLMNTHSCTGARWRINQFLFLDFSGLGGAGSACQVGSGLRDMQVRNESHRRTVNG